MGSVDSGILGMPVDVLAMVVSKLSFQDLLILGMTCRSLHSAASSDIVWMDKCRCWEEEVNLHDWRQAASSAKALFRLLRSLSKLKGVWSSQDENPRGGLLYTTWGSFSLGGWKVVPQSLTRVSFVPLFEVIGLVDGSTRVDIVSSTSSSRLPVSLKWLSHGEFQLLVSGDGDPERGWNSADQLSRDHPLLKQNSLESSLGDDHIDEHAESFGMRTIQYLKRFATTLRNGKTSSASDISFSYRRVELGSNPEQKLTGLWCGIYGPHGLEVVAIQYINEQIIGLKILGDPHVPCNKVSFQVDFGSESKSISPGLESLATMLSVPGRIDPGAKIVSSYAGTGKIAGFNYKNPQWVLGRLLVHENGNISFLWENVNFVIHFHRLELQSLFNSSVGGDDHHQVSNSMLVT